MKKDCSLASSWLRNFPLLCKRWTEFNKTWQEARCQRPLPSLCFFGPIGKPRWRPWFGFLGHFLFSSATAEQNSTKLDRKQIINVLFQVCVFRTDGKTMMDARPGLCMIGWYIFDFFSSQNQQTELDETWLEAISQRPLLCLCFFRPIGKSRWLPWPLIDWNICTFFSATAEENSIKFDIKKDLKVPYKLKVSVFRADGTENQYGRSVILIGCDIFDSPLSDYDRRIWHTW